MKGYFQKHLDVHSEGPQPRGGHPGFFQMVVRHMVAYLVLSADGHKMR